MTRDILSDAGADAHATSPSRWTAAHVRAIPAEGVEAAPLLDAQDFQRIADDLDIWDAWPIQDRGGLPVPVAEGETLWMALAAPRFDDPDQRHGHARIHLIHRSPTGWRDLGPAMPDGFSPGSREWSGSAVLSDGDRVTLYFTAAGRRGEASLSFEQRLFSARATLVPTTGGWALVDWRDLHEAVLRDPDHYMDSNSGSGAVGTIKAFRDPAYFRDPANGRHYLFFAASLAGSPSAFNGAIGLAVSDDPDRDEWRILPPLITAEALNNELERPHVVFHRGRYYLFWVTQSHVFDPAGPAGPTGLYGMTAERLEGPWDALNGTGLVFSNPARAPRQAYAWFVMADLEVTSFVDDWGAEGTRPAGRRFGATFAPMVRLRLDGSRATLER
ncbi:glycoside hydrolase family 68 protein [Sphingomonas sp.]|uniref:glycoside hydrolase family 68 protein n=1 Tax=Sphingomonas sp. TaxID=28214 RepID=UPI003B3AF582